MISTKTLKLQIFFFLALFMLNSCQDMAKKLPGGDARKFPADPEKRIKKNLKEGKGLRLSEIGKQRGGVFDFASSNGLWRASLDTIDFMPLLTADYGGGIIVTDWFNNSDDENKSLKISIQFLSNEIRADALNIKVFKKNCEINTSCKIINSETNLNSELKLAILKKAAKYEKESFSKMKKKDINYYSSSSDK